LKLLKLLNIDFKVRPRVIDISNSYSDLFFLKETNEEFQEPLLLNLNDCFIPKHLENSFKTSKHKLLIASWIWDTCATLRLHPTTSFFAFVCWLNYLDINFSETIAAAACCSLLCKINEVKCFSPSTWAKSVNCRVSELLSAENEIIFKSKGSLLPKFSLKNSNEIAAAYIFLACTDYDLNKIYNLKDFKNIDEWQKYRLLLPKITKFAEK
jgi:hypothetical protein